MLLSSRVTAESVQLTDESKVRGKSKTSESDFADFPKEAVLWIL